MSCGGQTNSCSSYSGGNDTGYSSSTNNAHQSCYQGDADGEAVNGGDSSTTACTSSNSSATNVNHLWGNNSAGNTDGSGFGSFAADNNNTGFGSISGNFGSDNNNNSGLFGNNSN